MDAPLVKKTPSALKWLAEKRARAAHDVEHLQRLSTEVQRRLEVVRLDLAALDRAIHLYDANIDPAKIAAVQGWKGKYGTRGALKDAILRALAANGGDWVSTDVLELAVTGDLGLSFDLPALRKRWYDNTFTKQLRRLASQGIVDRLHDTSPLGRSCDTGHWRLARAQEPTLADLRSRGECVSAK